MSEEPYAPVPPPEENDHWEPVAARCLECGSVVDVIHEKTRTYGVCAADGEVDFFYPTGNSQVAEKEEE